jgi:hypothetical protein
VTLTPANVLRMAAVIAGVVIALIGLVMWYRWGLDGHQASTLRRFVLPVAVSITGTILVAVGATLSFVPSSNMPSVDRVGNSPETVTASVMAPADSAGDRTSAGSPQRADGGAPAERRRGQVALTDGYAVDLDSRDADWNITQAEYVHFGERLDLRLFTLLDVHVGIVKVKPSAGYSACANSTGQQTEIAHDEFSAGDAFCVETDEGRFARVVITAKETDSTYSSRVRMDVVVWERAGM